MKKTCLALLATLAVSAAAKPPNIIFLFSDDHAFQAISAYGSKINQTPHIDRLAREGVLFNAAYCGNSICGPSRATVLTGKHSNANGFRANQWGDRFDGSQPTLPKYLQAAGYTTGIIGKWHLETDPTGFDEWMIHPAQGDYYNPDFFTAKGKQRIEGYATDITVDLSLDFIQRHKGGDKPFLLMCQFKAPHRNWLPLPKYRERFKGVVFPEPETLFDDYSGRASPAAGHKMGVGADLFPAYDLKLPSDDPNAVNGTKRMTPAQREAFFAMYKEENDAYLAAQPQGRAKVSWNYQRYLRDYLACVASVDDNIGRLLAYLDENGLSENTLVVYSSDQGFYLGEHGWYDKRWRYEESFRMPLLMRWPAKLKPGTVVDRLVQNIDFAPTLMDAAGLSVPADMHGVSVLPLLADPKAPWRDSLYYRYYEIGTEHEVPAHRGVRKGPHKLIHYPATSEWELFDLAKDPRELRSVAADPAYAGIRKDLEAELERLRVQYGDNDPLDMKRKTYGSDQKLK